MTEIVTADIGGTNARFAIAEVSAGKVLSLAPEVTLKTAEHASLKLAWEAFGRNLGRSPPNAAALAVAAPIEGDVIKMTNSPWTIRPEFVAEELGLERHLLINDFGAVGHAVAHAGPEYFRHLCGPDVPLPSDGVISIIGPGTGLGVAALLRRRGQDFVIETEGGHMDFAPLDSVEDVIVGQLRSRYGRVSAERIVSGPGFVSLYETLARIQRRSATVHDDEELWGAALADDDTLAASAFDRFCLSLGAVAGDIALAHGAKAVVLAGGLGLRIADHLHRSSFAQRFTAKGRFERRMAAMPVKLITHPQPGLFGAASAFAAEYP
jgi:glucokinase